METVQKIYPTAEELGKINKNPSCPECTAIFTSESNLNLHLAKTHKKTHLLESANCDKIYHCPVTSCSYHNTSHFKKLKVLKQHYLKVHSEKNFPCSSCKKGFPTESACNRHAEYCNVNFKCCECDMYYDCYETLKTHSRRKKHTILDKAAYKSAPHNLNLRNQKSQEIVGTSKMRPILPKPSRSTGMIVSSDTAEQSCQTEKSNRNTQETQTRLVTRMPQFTVETQTIGDYITRRSESMTNNLRTTKTQTTAPNPKTAASNTMCSLDDFELNMINEVIRNSSSTQTTMHSSPENIYSSTSIHTDTSDLLTEIFDSNFFNCHMETQTDFIFNDDLFKYCDDNTNMCTQTCENLLLGEIGLSDNHTQTVFDDILKSVESQTVMSQSRKAFLSCTENMINIETQTDNHFKQILEEINA